MKKYSFKPIAKRGALVAAMLIVSMVSDVVSIGLSVFDLRMIARADQLTVGQIDFWQSLSVLSMPLIVLYFIIVVIVCFWIYRASANAHFFRRSMDVSPPWAIGWYFIPVANLWKPFSTMEEIWRASFSRAAGKPAPRDTVLRYWWGFWIVAGITGNISFRLALGGSNMSTVAIATWLAIISAIASIGAAWNLRSAVLTISSAQTDLKVWKDAQSTETIDAETIEVASQ